MNIRNPKKNILHFYHFSTIYYAFINFQPWFHVNHQNHQNQKFVDKLLLLRSTLTQPKQSMTGRARGQYDPGQVTARSGPTQPALTGNSSSAARIPTRGPIPLDSPRRDAHVPTRTQPNDGRSAAVGERRRTDPPPATMAPIPAAMAVEEVGKQGH